MTLDLDIPALLEAIGEDSRCGTDLRSDDNPNNSYRRIRDVRNAAREEERRADVGNESHAEARRLWNQVWDDGQEYLKNVAKDLEIVAYMIEASIRIGGFGGLAEALRLTAELLTNFWGELLPTPDEDGIETTLRPISRLNGDVISYPLMRVAMTEDSSVGVMVVWQYAQAKLIETLSVDECERRVSAGAVTIDKFNRAVAESTDQFYFQLAKEIREANAAVLQLGALFEDRVGDDEAPNLSKFKKGIEDGESVLQKVAGHRLVQNTDEAAAVATPGSSNAPALTASAAVSSGPISSRTNALDLLETVAKWFEIHEPQSILPSEIRKAIRRGKMSPQELYVDLISDSEVRRQLYKDVGMTLPEIEA